MGPKLLPSPPTLWLLLISERKKPPFPIHSFLCLEILFFWGLVITYILYNSLHQMTIII